AITVADPAFVDFFIFEGHHTLDAIELDLGDQVRAQAVMRANGATSREFPRTTRHLEELGQQRTDRTEVDDVAGKFGFNRLTQEGGDFRELATVHHADFHDAADLFAETDAAGAVDVTLHAFGGNERTHALGGNHALRFLIARSRLTVTHGEILQLALTALVTYRTIQRVIDQQELHDRVLGGNGLL